MDLNKKIYISIGIFSALCLLFIFFLIYPRFINIKNSSEEILFKKNSLFSFSEREKNLKKNEDFYQSYREDIEKIDKLLIDPKVPIEFVRFLEDMASELSLSIKISSLTIPEKKENLWPSFSLFITTDGSFSNSMKFLGKLENNPYLVEVLSLKTNESKEKEGNVNFLYSVKIFTQ